MRKHYGKKGHSSLTYVSKSITKAYGEDRGKYTKVKGTESLTQIRRIEEGVNALLNSPYSTSAGRQQLHRDQIKMLMSKDSNLTREQAESILDIFESKEWEKIRSRSGQRGSGLDLDTIMNNTINKVSVDETIQSIKDYLKTSDSVRNYVTFSDRINSILDTEIAQKKDVSFSKVSSLLAKSKGDMQSVLAELERVK